MSRRPHWVRLLRPPCAYSSDSDVHTTARAERAAVTAAGGARRGCLVLDDHQALRILAIPIAVGVALALLRILVAQAELQAIVAGLQAGILQGLLQLRRVAAQQIERF